MSIELISNTNPKIFNYNLIEPSVSEINSVSRNKHKLVEKLGLLQSKIKLNKLANPFKSKATRLERNKNEFKRKQFNPQPECYNRGNGSGCEPFGGD
jgi:hypothetical protein